MPRSSSTARFAVCTYYHPRFAIHDLMSCHFRILYLVSLITKDLITWVPSAAKLRGHVSSLAPVGVRQEITTNSGERNKGTELMSLINEIKPDTFLLAWPSQNFFQGSGINGCLLKEQLLVISLTPTL